MHGHEKCCIAKRFCAISETFTQKKKNVSYPKGKGSENDIAPTNLSPNRYKKALKDEIKEGDDERLVVS